MLTRRSPFVVLVVAFVVLCAFSMHFASASSQHESRTVLFQDLTIDGDNSVTGNLNILFGNVTCEDGGEIDGDVHNVMGHFDAEDGCVVKGRVYDAFDGGPVAVLAPPFTSFASSDLNRQNHHVLKKLAWDVVVVLAFLLFPLRVRVALDRVEAHPGLSFAVGTLALIGAIPVAILLLISVIGLPLIPLEFAALFAGLWIGNAAVALLIGRRLYELLRPHTTPSPLGALAFGLLVITAAETLPVVGWAVTALVVLIGLGAALLAFIRETSFRSFIGGPMNSGPLPGAAGVSPPPPPGPPMNRPAI